MRLRFFGGAQEVGRSSIMLEGSTRILMDYGITIGNKIAYPSSMPDVDAVVLSHAHLDHSGAVPLLFNEMSIPVYGTGPTMEISELLLQDSMKIARRKGLSERFHKRELNGFMRHFVSMGYHESRMIGNLSLTVYDAGHICGSAISMIEAGTDKKKERIVYTGDMKLSGQELHRGAEIVDSDVLIIESTYADRNHPDREDLKRSFIDKIKDVTGDGGTALVPSFAVGRAQEILVMLEKNGLSEMTYLDGMAKDATKITMRSEDFVDSVDLLRRAAGKISWIENNAERDKALQRPSIIVTTAGMLDGGPVLNYIRRLRNNSHIFFTGYQIEGTNGHSFMQRKKIMINGRLEEPNADFSYYDFSAHAGADELHDYIRRSGAHTVVCVHGSKENTIELADYAKAQGCKAYAPAIGDAIEL